MINFVALRYLFVRLYKVPQRYGITHEDFDQDPTLVGKRRELIHDAASKLFSAKLIRYEENSRSYATTDVGRVASKFYVDWQTAELFSKSIRKNMGDQEIIKLFGQASEFDQLKVREDEQQELMKLRKDKNVCSFQPLGGTDNNYGKVGILLQAYISRAHIDSFSLIADTNYIVQNASRVLRAMFEITMTRVVQASEMAERLLEWFKMVDRRLWDTAHPLRAFCHPPTISAKGKVGYSSLKQEGGVLKERIVQKLEDSGFWPDRLYEMTHSEIKAVVGDPGSATAVMKYNKRVPWVELTQKVQPITASIMRVTATIKPDFDWSDRWSGPSEPFFLWVENPENHDILHTESFQIQKQASQVAFNVSFCIPFCEPRPPQYILSVVSERWVGCKFVSEFSVSHLLLPDRAVAHTNLLPLTPLHKNVLQNERYESLYKFTHFNAIQTQVFHTCYHTDYNVLLGAPTGSGKTNVAEFCMFRVFNQSSETRGKIIYIAPLKALSRERIADWGERFGRQLGKRVVELTGDFTPDAAALDKADVVVTTPEKWDGISRHWQHRHYVQRVSLVVIDEIHLLGQDRGPVLEVIVSRMRYISAHVDTPIRFVGLSTALANARDIADWLGIGQVGLYNFRPSVRPVPMTVHVQGYPEKHYCPRMATMNKPVYNAIKSHSPDKPVLVFVASRRQTRLTAQDLVGLIQSDEDASANQFCGMDSEMILYCQKRVQDSALREAIEFGIGLHHAGLIEQDRKVVEELFLDGRIRVLICTSTLAWGVNFPAHLVVIKGTEFFDASLRRYVDFPITDVLQMMGRAGRPQFDTSAKAVVMVHEPKKQFYRRFLYEPFPVESSLHEQLTDHINAEIVAGTVTTKEEAIEYITWTYFFRRLTQNPSYYDPQALALADEPTEAGRLKDLLAGYLDRLINKCFDDLVRSGCISVKQPELDPVTGVEMGPVEVQSVPGGKIASFYYLSHRSVAYARRLISKDRLSFVGVMRALCDFPEYEELPVRHNEDKANAEFSDICPLPLDPIAQYVDSPHTKAFLLIQAHFWKLPMPISDYYTDLKSVLDQSLRIIQAMADIAADEAQLATHLHLGLLSQCLHQGLPPWKNTLAMLEPFGLNSNAIDHLGSKHSIHSIAELLEAGNRERIISSLPVKHTATGEILKLCRQLPRLRVAIEVRVLPDDDDAEDMSREARMRRQEIVPLAGPPYVVPPEAELELSVGLRYINTPEKYAIAPRFPKKKTFSWWVTVGDVEVDELIASKRVMMHAGKNLVHRNFYS